MSISPYTGAWTHETAFHLLRRTSFSTRKNHIDQALIDGMDKTVDAILSYKAEGDYPLNPFFQNDPDVPIGETWVNAGYKQDVPGLNNYRNRSMGGWIIKKMLEDSISIQEKLTLFWHNHFVVADINDARFVYRNYSLMRDNALGDFKQLVKDVTIDPSMLRYLNGRQNNKNAPNENYARELLELFTIGKGPTVGDGDYTTFTEDDVVEMARILTGWVDTGHRNENFPVDAVFLSQRHDTGTKQLSHRFNNEVVNDAGENEYANLVDIIFKQDEVSRHIVRKLYRWFVFHDINAEVEADVIEPLAQILRDNDYVIKPVLDTLFKSEHFYSNCGVGALIKSPIDYIMSTFSAFDSNAEVPGLASQYTLWFGILEGAALLQQSMYNHPNVAGWKAYYQEPVYYRIWLNSVTLPIRSQIQDILWILGIQVPGIDQPYKIDAFKPLEYVSQPTDINILIQEISSFVFPRALNQGQIDYLKNVVLEGLPDFEWTVEYAEYLGDPTNEDVKMAVESKLRLLYRSMCNLPEFHLS